MLPVRYAIARADHNDQGHPFGNAPSLPPGFGKEVPSGTQPGGGAKPGVALPALPGGIARYTLRLLRPGYLYVYDEHRNEWRGYVVNVQSYLSEFDIHAKMPPAVGEKTFNAACRAKSDPYIARCFTVKDADRATRIWLGFSKSPWTAAVLKKHMQDKTCREAHMRCIDMESWRKGGAQAHMASFDALTSVAEFAADGKALHDETYRYVQRFVPVHRLPPTFHHVHTGRGGNFLVQDSTIKYGHGTPADLMGSSDEARQMLADLAPQFRDSLLPGALGKQPVTSGLVKAAAWAFSPFDMRIVDPAETRAMQAWGKQASHWRPAIVGLSDPASILMELNALTTCRTIEFMEIPDRKWMLETISTIEAFHNIALYNLANKEVTEATVAKMVLPGTLGGAIRGDVGDLSTPRQRMLLEKDLGWEKKYLAELKEGAWPGAQEQYAKDLHDFDQNTVAPLDRAYVGWLENESFHTYFTHNFDPANVDNGILYQTEVYNCIESAGSRKGAGNYLKDALDKDPETASNIVVRALVFNQQKLAREWNSLARATSHGTVSWMDIGGKFYSAVRQTLVDGSMGNDIKGPFSNLSKFVYNLVGPLTSSLGDMLNEAEYRSVAKLPYQQKLTMMMGVLHADHPHLELVDMRLKFPPEWAAKTLARAMANAAGVKEQTLYDKAHTFLQEKSGGYTFRGLLLVDKGKLKKMAAAGVNSAEFMHAVTEENFEKFFKGNFRSTDAEVRGGVIGMIFGFAALYASFKDLLKSRDPAIASLNLGANLLCFMGCAMDISGRVMEKTPWFMPLIGTRILGKFGDNEFSARKLIGFGKWVGFSGGVLLSAMDIWDGYDNWKYDKHYGATMVVLGSGELIATFITLTSFTGIGLALGIAVFSVAVFVKMFSPDPMQKWMARCLLGKLDKDDGDRFHTLFKQRAELNNMARG